MKIQDIFIPHENDQGFCVRTTSFAPNASDQELKAMLNDMVNNLRGRAIGISCATISELKAYRDDIVMAISEDANGVQALADELMELRQLTRKIQAERDALVDFIAEEVLGATPDSKPTNDSTNG